MSSYLLGFFLPLAGIATLIFLLSMLQYRINGNIAKNTSETDTQYSATDEQKDNINQARGPPVADAIHAYRRYRQADEHARAKREQVTIVVLTWTAIFAFLAAVFAGVSALIFNGQLGEMHQASVDSNNLVITARETEERQLRAYVSITGDVLLQCISCKTDMFWPFTPSPKHIVDNAITFSIQNGGQTPAYNVSLETGFYYADYGQGLPAGFTYPITNGTQSLVGISPSMRSPTATIGPHDKMFSMVPIEPPVIPNVIRAQQHEITLFYYGIINYTDVFIKRRVTPFCFEYLPDIPNNEQFANCEEHNAPPPGG